MSTPYSVYILRCRDGTYYVGSTRDVAERLARHNEGRAATYTAIRRPVVLVYSEDHSDQLAAIRRERQLKGWSHAKRDALVRGDYEKLKELSRRRT
ncbi:MAG: GIY-YIG nuclease family protein [Capsulimonadaceae bacterium]|nr:GIY-YIG nuclease family protein [Capsulimonadaceae bacterium]